MKWTLWWPATKLSVSTEKSQSTLHTLAYTYTHKHKETTHTYTHKEKTHTYTHKEKTHTYTHKEKNTHTHKHTEAEGWNSKSPIFVTKEHEQAKNSCNSGFRINKQHQPGCRTLLPSECPMLLGRSPRKNCKNDLDDQTWLSTSKQRTSAKRHW